MKMNEELKILSKNWSLYVYGTSLRIEENGDVFFNDKKIDVEKDLSIVFKEMVTKMNSKFSEIRNIIDQQKSNKNLWSEIAMYGQPKVCKELDKILEVIK